jgi:predicted HAD superfamily Cof-like phosphohydrolase
MNRWQQDVLEFHRKFHHVINDKPTIPDRETTVLRLLLIMEEVGELCAALGQNDLIKIADGMADSIVVILGTAVSYGIDMEGIWEEVHRANMAKVGGGKSEVGKSLKPPGWAPPRIKEELEMQSED